MSAHSALNELGLNEKEIKVYLCLVKSGRLTPAAIARITRINRATVYNIASSLLSKGIIAEDRGGKTLYFTVLPPSSLQQIIERPRRELARKESLIKNAISELMLVSADGRYSVPKIRFIEEDNLENFLYENCKKWIAELHRSDGIWWGFQDHSFVEHYEKFVEWASQLKEYRDARIQSKLLTNDSSIEEKIGRKVPRTKRQVRFADGMNFTSSVWVSGDYLVMIVTAQHPFHLVEIHDATLAHNMREVLKKLWELTEKK